MYQYDRFDAIALGRPSVKMEEWAPRSAIPRLTAPVIFEIRNQKCFFPGFDGLR